MLEEHYKILKTLNEKHTLTLNVDISTEKFHELLKLGYVVKEVTKSDGYSRPTQTGRIVLTASGKEELQRHSRRQFNHRLSVIAIILSSLSILLDLLQLLL